MQYLFHNKKQVPSKPPHPPEGGSWEKWGLKIIKKSI